MTFRQIISVIRLRWYVTALIALVTMVAGWTVDHPQRVYQAESVLLLVPPVDPHAPNSLAAATPSIAATGVLVDTVLGDSTSTDRLRRAGVSGDYQIVPRNNGTVQTPKYSIPAEQLTVTGTDPNAVLASVSTLTKVFMAELDDLQARANVPKSLRITTQELVPPSVAPVLGSKKRGLIGVALLGVLALVILPQGFDRYMRRRSRRARVSRSEGLTV
ncbi:MAG: hypothetical protein ACRDVE_07875 [Actinocrinis sp.]